MKRSGHPRILFPQRESAASGHCHATVAGRRLKFGGVPTENTLLFVFIFRKVFQGVQKRPERGSCTSPHSNTLRAMDAGGGHPSLNLLPPPPHSYVRRSTSTTPYPQWMRGPCSSVPRLHATPQRVPSSTRKWMRGPCSSVPPPVSATAGRAMAAEAAAASSVPTASSSTADAGAEPLTASSATTASSTAPATVPTPPRGGAQSPGPRG